MRLKTNDDGWWGSLSWLCWGGCRCRWWRYWFCTVIWSCWQDMSSVNILTNDISLKFLIKKQCYSCLTLHDVIWDLVFGHYCAFHTVRRHWPYTWPQIWLILTATEIPVFIRVSLRLPAISSAVRWIFHFHTLPDTSFNLWVASHG